MTETIL